ncbi:MAG: 16S rRNA (guanine(966)-N(2))-methyltransferase RsmD [Clostridia bacterium]|nr:16S rRNA (guanine(966)-N(2))-methyltransferase RsmD [Clostridia bacterium]
MRIITGTARGTRLETVAGDDLVRPTPEKVKEALFSALQFDIEGRRILDLFAGSGQLGLECLSRGAASATFVDSAERSLACVRNNAARCGLTAGATVVRSDYNSFLSGCRSQFDIAFLDPPYGTGILQKALPPVTKVMSEAGLIVCEHPLTETLEDICGDFSVVKRYRYGKIGITLYRRSKEKES